MVLKSFTRAAASTDIYVFFLLGFLQRKVDEIARLSETRRKEQERNFRLVSLERGSSHRGTVVGALACHLVRVLVGTLYVGWVCFGFSLLLSLISRCSKGKGKGIRARGRREERFPPPSHALCASRASEVPFTFPSECRLRRLFSAERGFSPGTHRFDFLENQHFQFLFKCLKSVGGTLRTSKGHKFF